MASPNPKGTLIHHCAKCGKQSEPCKIIGANYAHWTPKNWQPIMKDGALGFYCEDCKPDKTFKGQLRLETPYR